MELSSGYRAYFDDDNPQLLALEALENTYAKSGNVLFAIVPRADDAMSERTLEATAWLTERAWQTPYSTRVDSLTDFQHTTADGDDLLICDLVDEAGPRDAAERSRIRAFALAEPAAARNPTYACQPICEAIRDIGGNFILTCKPTSHETLYECLQGIALQTHQSTVGRHRQKTHPPITLDGPTAHP